MVHTEEGGGRTGDGEITRPHPIKFDVPGGGRRIKNISQKSEDVGDEKDPAKMITGRIIFQPKIKRKGKLPNGMRLISNYPEAPEIKLRPYEAAVWMINSCIIIV